MSALLARALIVVLSARIERGEKVLQTRVTSDEATRELLHACQDDVDPR